MNSHNMEMTSILWNMVWQNMAIYGPYFDDEEENINNLYIGTMSHYKCKMIDMRDAFKIVPLTFKTKDDDSWSQINDVNSEHESESWCELESDKD